MILPDGYILVDGAGGLLDITGLQVLAGLCQLITFCGGVTNFVIDYTGCPISSRKYILQITQPSQYKYTKLQYRFAVFSGAPSTMVINKFDVWANNLNTAFSVCPLYVITVLTSRIPEIVLSLVEGLWDIRAWCYVRYRISG